MKQYLNFDNKKFNNYSLRYHFVTFFSKIELVFFIILSLFFLTFSRFSDNFRNNISYLFFDISTPFVNAAVAPFNVTIDLLVNFKELATARKENKFLKAENERMQQLLIQAVNIENENQELKKILKFVVPRSLNYKMVNITGRTHASFAQKLFIEAKEGESLKNGSVVLGNVALLGRVIDASQNRGRVLLPTDAASRIPIIASKSRTRGVLYGNNSSLMEIEYLPKDHQIKVGELIFTSSDGETLPPGILIGMVKEVDNHYVAVEMVQDIVNADIATVVEY